MKKNLLFVVSDLDKGGITSSLINLLSGLVRKDEYKISLLVMNGDNICDTFLEERVNIVHLSGKAKYWTLKNFKGNKIKYYFIGFFKKLFNIFGLWNRFCFSKIKFNDYDYVFGYRQSPAVLDLISKSKKTSKRFLFWHGDPDFMHGLYKWIKKINKVDGIICVSEYIRNRMECLFSNYQKNFYVVQNAFNKDVLLERAKTKIKPFSNNKFNIISVARISFDDKNVNIIPFIAKSLKRKISNFCWRIIGDGPDIDKLKQLVETTNTGDVIEIYGSSDNPYPYIKNSDLLVLTSNTESFGMVLVEALLLQVPCISSSFPAFNSVYGKCKGVIACNNSIEFYDEQILKLITDFDYYHLLKSSIDCTNLVEQGFIQFKELIEKYG